MKKDFVTVVYDRKKEVTKTGRGKVEIRIYLGNGVRKYVTLISCDPFEWKEYEQSDELRTQCAIYRHVIEAMIKNGEELTIANIDLHIGKDSAKKKENREVLKKKASKTGFIDFMVVCGKDKNLVQNNVLFYDFVEVLLTPINKSSKDRHQRFPRVCQ